MVRKRLGAALVAIVLLVGGYAYAAQEINGGLLRWLINGVRQPSGVSEINCKSDAGACYRDGGVATIDLDRVGGGGGSDAPAGCQPNQAKAASNDGGASKCVAFTFNADNSVTFADGTSFSGPIWNATKNKVDGFPDAVVSQASVSPQDRDAGAVNATGFLPQRFRATGGYTTNGDAYVMPNAGCSVGVPNNQTLRFEVQFHGTKVPGVDASSIPTGSCWVRRKYEVTNANGTLTVTVIQAEADTGGCGPGAGSGYQIDGGGAGASGVVSPVFVGAAATQIRVECELVDWYVTSNP